MDFAGYRLKGLNLLFPSECKWKCLVNELGGSLYQERVPFRNILFFHQQMLLTRGKCLYNGRRVGEYLS
jgi:hypothetical protein